MDTIVRINPNTGSELSLWAIHWDKSDKCNFSETENYYSCSFPFCRALCGIPVSILASQTDSAVFSKQLRKPSHFNDLAINKWSMMYSKRNSEEMQLWKNTGTSYSISKLDLDNQILMTERLCTRDGPQLVLLRSLKSLIVNTKYIILCNPKYNELFLLQRGFSLESAQFCPGSS